MQLKELKKLVLTALDDVKAQDVRVLEVQKLTTVADLMVIATGTSTRHIQALADNIVKCAKEAKHMPLGVEGRIPGEWMLVDLGDIVIHIMLEKVRDFYSLEKLWAPINTDNQEMQA